jgi:C1A family cysteine protease
MKKSIFIFTFFAVTLIIAVFVSCTKENASLQSGQDLPQYSLGCNLLPIAQYEAIPLATPEYELKALPLFMNLSTPWVGDQGGEGSCVAWGTTYASRSIDWYVTNGNTSYSYSTNIFSPEYVYNQIKATADCARGSSVLAGLNLLKSQGVCTWSSMPYTDEDCSTMPNPAQIAEAASYKISSYNRVTIETNTIKTYLANYKPVIVAGPVNKAFVNLQKNQVLGKFTGKTLGGHCYCLVGYDDARKAFKFQNSWGPTWASDGYGWISYTYIKSWWPEAYVINTTVNP